MAILKQSTAFTRMFLMVQSSDHISALTGATCTVNLSKAGAAFGAAGGTITEVANGWYKIALTTTDTNTLGDLAYHITATSGDPTDFVDQVTTNILGDTLPVSVTQWNGTNVSSPATAGIPDVNVKNMNNVAATSITTINANQGTTQPINFTGTSTSALVKSDMTDIAGSAVSTTTAQLGVNVVNINAVSAASVTAINANQGTTQPLNFTGTSTSALVKSDMIDIASAAVSTSTAQIGTNVVSVAGGASNIKKNQALTAFMFLMTDSTTHAPKTGLTITATRSLDGATFSACANSAAEVANGWYSITLANTDMNANVVALRFTATGADDRDITLLTQP